MFSCDDYDDTDNIVLESIDTDILIQEMKRRGIDCVDSLELTQSQLEEINLIVKLEK